MKQKLANSALPIARFIVRHTPPGRLRELAWRWGHWRSRDFKIKTANGLWFKGNTRDLIQCYLYFFGTWEPNLTRLVVERMEGCSNRLFVDIGANIGYFAMLAARSNPSNRVVAIEALPATHSKLISNIKLNDLDNIKALQCAVSDISGTIDLYFPGSQNEGATTSNPERLARPSAPITVRSQSLSEILSDQDFSSIRLIKIDVEGGEPGVIKGLQAKIHLIPEDAEIVVEISGDSKEDSQFIFETLTDQGFRAYSLDNDYDPMSYLYPKETQSLHRMNSPPSKQTDVLFSRFLDDHI